MTSSSLTAEDTRLIAQWCKEIGFECARRPWMDMNADSLVIDFENGFRMSIDLQALFVHQHYGDLEKWIKNEVRARQEKYTPKVLEDKDEKIRLLREAGKSAAETAQLALERLQRAEEVIERVRMIAENATKCSHGGIAAIGQMLKDCLAIYDRHKPS